MDGLVVAGVAISSGLAAGWATWFLMAWQRQQHRRDAGRSHAFRGQGEAVTVAELLEEAAKRGEAVRLNWSDADLDATARRQERQFPTVILPRIDDGGDR